MMEQVAQIRHELPTLREVVSLSDWTAFIESGSPTERLPTVQPQEPWLIEFTSGTTGLPKPALLHHTGMINSSRWVAERMDVSPDDRWLNFLPLFYVAGGVIANFAALQSSAASIRAGSVPESHREGAVLVVHYTRDHSENAARTCRPHVDGSPQPTDDHYWRHALST
jgi:fatty-acyl-CoA synthase